MEGPGMNAEKAYDVIVAGTGPGGATVARELTNRGKKVLMLEWGPYEPIRGSALQAAYQLAFPGKGMLITNKALALVRGITTGGSSVFYYETAFQPPLDLLKKYGVDVEAEVAEARAELPIAPLSDDLMGPMAKRLMQSGQELGFDWQKLPKYIYQDKCRPDCWRCQYGCPYGAKWGARMYVEEALEKGAELIARAKVNRVITDGRQALGVEYTRMGQKHRALADRVIVAAGGIGSPMILRGTGIKDAGYDFFFDPVITVNGTVNDIDGGKEIPMAAGLNMVSDGYMMTDMTIPKELYAFMAVNAGRPDRALSHRNTLTVMVKIKDDLGGKLSHYGGVRKPLSKRDLEKLHTGAEAATRVLKNTGAHSIYKSWYLASHPGGTAKINEIVDSDLKTKYEGLYVCDCSVIPESWGLPPTLTLISLGKRLAKHLVN
jgi:choline dehydrogenase-like flavoprotein